LYAAEDAGGNYLDLMESGYGSAKVDVLNWLDIEWVDYGED
jgi:hypothetical protein